MSGLFSRAHLTPPDHPQSKGDGKNPAALPTTRRLRACPKLCADDWFGTFAACRRPPSVSNSRVKQQNNPLGPFNRHLPGAECFCSLDGTVPRRAFHPAMFQRFRAGFPHLLSRAESATGSCSCLDHPPGPTSGFPTILSQSPVHCHVRFGRAYVERHSLVAEGFRGER